VEKLPPAERARYDRERKERLATQDPIEWRGLRLELTEEWLAATPTVAESLTMEATDYARSTIGALEVRRKFRREFAWAVPTPEALERLADLAPIVEIGAGAGYWAWLLREGGVTVYAYDLNPPSSDSPDNSWHQGVDAWTEIEPGDSLRAAEHPEATLFLCWPPDDLPVGAYAVASHAAAGGKSVVIVGEGPEGRTGDHNLFELLATYYDETERLAIPQWPHLHDYMAVFRRNGKKFV
jgi:hypothetical protein